ncbi:hypothetical protein EHO61_07540 [Leptospira fluminis]|uniref:Lipoprotein n=1 Tax=Leptospira fluminis TaxID=2484979 RepID=A0A4R9GQ57_9LEPT|nr:hypothetical protein [Leptospira fluminis]TGK19315.1 hypothetical protein EHO61_07540 [Leptospira fluminis]
MSRTLLNSILAVALAVVAGIGCHKSTGSSNNAGTLLAMIAEQSQIGNAVGTGMNSVTNATSGSTDGSGTGVALFSPIGAVEAVAQNKKDYSSYLARLFSSPLEATVYTLNCPKGGTATRTPQGSDLTAAATVNVVWTYSNCAFGFGISMNGTLENDWTGLAATATPVQNGTVLNVASSVTLSDSALGASLTESASTNSLGTGIVNPQINVAHVLSFTSATAYTINTNITRSGTIFGKVIFSHTVTTPTPLNLSFNKGAGTRTVNSGVQSIKHNLANFTVSLTYSSVVYSYTTCQPTSGSISFTVSGNRNGSGTVSFNNGVATYTYTPTTASSGDKSESGTVSVRGCSMN